MSNDREKPGFVVLQEADQVNHRKVRAGALIAVVGIAASLGATLLFLRGEPGHAGGALPGGGQPRATGTVETSLILATERGIALRAEQKKTLDRWGWVDRDAGVAQIPIERAMDVVAARPALADGGPRP